MILRPMQIWWPVNSKKRDMSLCLPASSLTAISCPAISQTAGARRVSHEQLKSFRYFQGLDLLLKLSIAFLDFVATSMLT